MTPPRCYVCGLSLRDIPEADDLNDHFVLIHFAAEDGPRAAFEQQPGWVGHPHNVVWFCTKHAPLGEERRHLHAREALTEIDTIKATEPHA